MYTYTLKTDQGDFPRRLITIRDKGDNVLNSNLTELSAATSVNRGFMNHNDWMAHVLRYQFVINHLNSQDRLLDVGCGNMQFPFYAYRNRVPPIQDYWCIDLRLTETWLVDIGWKVPLTAIRADFATDSEQIEAVPDFGGFDVIAYLEAFEHVGTRVFQEESVYNCYEWLRSGGFMFFSTPNAEVSDSTADNHVNPETGESREWRYSDKMDLLREVGFQVVESYGTFGALKRLPINPGSDPHLKAARQYLSTSMFTNFAFLNYPEQANNAIMMCRKP